MPVVIPLIGAAIAAGAGIYSAVDSADRADQSQRAQGALQAEAKAKEKKSLLDQAGIASRQRQRAQAASYGGPGLGVSTSPLGDTSPANTQKPTLLGG